MMVIVNEIFTSIQGEGVNTGLPSVFVRLAGCNLNCSWCDTSYSRSKEDGRPAKIVDVVNEVLLKGPQRVCITGGEPLSQEGTLQLSKELIERGMLVDIETNGSLDIGPFRRLGPMIMLSVDVKTPSSGESGSFLRSNLSHLLPSDQLKFIVKDGSDLEYALSFLEEWRPDCNIILTPCDNEGGEKLVEGLLDRVLGKDWVDDEHLRKITSRLRFMVQTHKVIWSRDRRGV